MTASEQGRLPGADVSQGEVDWRAVAAAGIRFAFIKATEGADLADYPLWLACYAGQPELPAGWQRWTFWQHSQSGSVDGIAGPVDLHCCQVSPGQLRRMRTT